MHQNLKHHKDQAFLVFHRVYIYITNTKKPWNELTNKQREHKKFKWRVVKLFVMANGPITPADIEWHMANCPETFEYAAGVNDSNFDLTVPEWKHCSHDYHIYEGFPLTEYDTKLLINTLGLRMCHLVNVNCKPIEGSNE